MERIKVYFIAVLLVIGITSQAHAVRADSPTLSLVGPVGLIHADDLIPVDIMASSGGLTINAAEVAVTYPSDRLQIEFVRREQSIFDLWAEPPTWDNDHGIMTLTGGHPGGLVAVQSRIATIYFRATVPGPVMATIDPAKSGLYLNDGLGTKVGMTIESIAAVNLELTDTLVPGIPLNTQTVPTPNTWSRLKDIVVSWTVDPKLKYSYTFTADCQAIPDDIPEETVGQVTYPGTADGVSCFTIKSRDVDGTWSLPSQYRFLIDATPPKRFSIFHPDPKSIGGANVLSWVVTDSISDITGTSLHFPGQVEKTVTSPLKIERAWKGKLLTFSAIDEAGNIQTATYQMPGAATQFWSSSMNKILMALVAVLLAAWLARRVYRRWRVGHVKFST